MSSRPLNPASLPAQSSVWGDVRHGRFYNRRVITIVLGFLGLIVAQVVVALGVEHRASMALVAVLGGSGLVYVVLRHPSALGYIALCWLVSEKIVEYHISVNRDTVDSMGNYLLVAALGWTLLLNLLRRRPLLSMRQIGGPLLLFVALSVLSTFINNVPLHVAELGILSTTHSIIMFLIIVNVGVQVRDVERFIYVVLGVLAVTSLVAVLQGLHVGLAWKLAGGPAMETSSGTLRVSGLFEHPNTLGDFMAMTVPLCLMLFFFGGFRGNARMALLLLNVVSLVALALTLSRETWGALLLATLFLGLTVEPKLRHVFFRLIVPGLVLGLLLFVPFLHRLQDTAKGDLRFSLLQATLPVIRDHLLLGAGPGRYGGHVALITHTPLYQQYQLPNFFYGTGGQIDMFWTHLVAEAGLLGALSYLWIIGACFMVGRRAYRTAVTPRRRALLLGLLYAIPGTVLVSLLSTTLENNPTATMFWTLLGGLTVLAAAPDAPPHSLQALRGEAMRG